MNNPIDQVIRDEVVDPNSSFVVEAPAGSGKTTLLAKRILNLLTVVDNPKEIIAISFTNKAAGEMHDTFLKEYENDGNQEVVKKIKARVKKLGWNESFQNSLEIMTIDSLASKITRQAPILSGSLYKNVTDDPHKIYESAVKETIRDNAQLSELFPFLNYDYQKIEEYLIDLLKKRDQWKDNIFEYKNMDPIDIENKTKAYYAQETKMWVERLKILFDKDERSDVKNILTYLNPTFSQQEDKIAFWLNFRDLIMTKGGKVGKRFGPKEGFEKDKEGELYKDKLLKLISNNYSRNNILEDLNNVLYEEKITDIFPTIMHSASILLSELYIKLQQQFNLRSEFDYIQAVDNAIDTLKDTNVAILFDENVSHILIDEFQDTNNQQKEFLELLTQNFAGNPKKSFFAVGDPMQSIYRFRKAEVNIFKGLQKNHKFGDIELKVCELTVNFRSNEKIINWLNTEYKQVFSKKDDMDKGLLKYHPSNISPDTKNIKGGGVQYQIYKNKINDSYSEQQEEARAVYDKIKELRDGNNDIEIAVLVRARSHLVSLLTKMRQDKLVPIEATEIDSIEYNQSFQDILCLTKALYNLNDRVSWIGILRAPWCGLKLEDLTCLFENNTSTTAWEIINTTSITKDLSADGQKRLARIKNIIGNNIQYRGRVAHRFFIESIWRQLLGVKTIEISDMQLIDKFLDLIDKSSSPLSIDFETLNRLTEDLHTDCQSNGNNPVKFYTIHKAKGKQFECVIIPGLGRIPKAEDHALISYDGEILSLNNNKNEEDNLYNYHRSKELTRLQNEKIRLLYVAITRAKEDCYLIGTISENKKDELSIPKNSFLKLLEPIINMENNKEFDERISDTYEIFSPKLRRLKSKYFNRVLEINTQTPSNKIVKDSKISTDNIYTFTGTLIHNYYEIVIKKQLDINNLLSKKLSYIYGIFMGNGYKESEINTAIEVVKESLLSLQKSKDGQWIYQLHKDEGMEVNYLHTIDDEIKILIPDRTFIEDGIKWIIDYKTVFNEQNKALNLEIEAKTHAEQLNIYESLFDDDHPVQKAIYFVAQGKLVLI